MDTWELVSKEKLKAKYKKCLMISCLFSNNNNSSFYVLGTVLSTLHVRTHLILMETS